MNFEVRRLVGENSGLTRSENKGGSEDVLSNLIYNI